jgi:hypothetical protein
MTAVVWANAALAIPFLLAFIGIPLWMTFRRPQTSPGHSQAHAYLRAKEALARASTMTPGRATSDTRHADRVAA